MSESIVRPATMLVVIEFLNIDVLHSAGLTVPYASNLFVSEDTVLVEVGETPSLLDKERRKTVSIRLIVFKFGAHVIENLESESLKTFQCTFLCIQTYIPLKDTN